MERRIIAVFTVMVLLLLTSCHIVISYYDVLRGNYMFYLGRYQDALIYYYKVDQLKRHSSRVRYNIGNVYWALGESDVALDTWARIEHSDDQTDDDILLGISFNRGLLYYEQGHFQQAYQNFIRALSIDPSHVEAKVNLELALKKLRASQQISRMEQGGAKKQVDVTTERILSYIKRKEGVQWRARFSGKRSPSLRDW